jgi:hypothetical protein
MLRALYQEVSSQRIVRIAEVGRSSELSVARTWHGIRQRRSRNNLDRVFESG